MDNVWHERNGQIWLKLELDNCYDEYRSVFVNLAHVQSFDPNTRVVTMNGGFTYDVTEGTINSIAEGLGFKVD